MFTIDIILRNSVVLYLWCLHILVVALLNFGQLFDMYTCNDVCNNTVFLYCIETKADESMARTLICV